jgi:hypothetical protein
MQKNFDTVLTFFRQHIWVTLFAIKANKFLKEQVSTIESEEIDIKLFSKKFDDAKRIIESFDKEHLERKKIIEEKARALLLIVTASITLTTSLLTYVYNLKEAHNGSLIVLIIGYVYLILCIIDVLATLATTEYYYISSSMYFTATDRQDELQFEDFDKSEAYLKVLYRNGKLNSIKNIMKQNRVSAAFENLQNGIILICLFFILSISQKMFTSPDKFITHKSRVPIYQYFKQEKSKILDAKSIKHSYLTIPLRQRDSL